MQLILTCSIVSRDAELLAGLVDQRPMFVEVETIQMAIGSGHLYHHLLVIHELSLPEDVRVGDAEPGLRLRLGELRLPNQGGLHL